MITPPPHAGPIADQSGMVTPTMAEWHMAVYRTARALYGSGTTAQRPTADLWVGRPYFDTTLGQPIWVSQVTPSVVWVDATGSTV